MPVHDRVADRFEVGAALLVRKDLEGDHLPGQKACQAHGWIRVVQQGTLDVVHDLTEPRLSCGTNGRQKERQRRDHNSQRGERTSNKGPCAHLRHGQACR